MLKEDLNFHGFFLNIIINHYYNTNQLHFHLYLHLSFSFLEIWHHLAIQTPFNMYNPFKDNLIRFYDRTLWPLIKNERKFSRSFTLSSQLKVQTTICFYRLYCDLLLHFPIQNLQVSPHIFPFLTQLHFAVAHPMPQHWHLVVFLRFFGSDCGRLSVGRFMVLE